VKASTEMPQQLATNTATGREFENYIASLYEALGFKVDRNTRVTGQQIDLVVRRSLPGIGPISTLVECKYLSRGSLSNQAVHDFAAFFSGVRETDGYTNAVIVCNREFSLDAKQAAERERHLQLKRQADLENELFDVTDILIHRVRSYEQQDIFHQFVRLSGRGRAPGLRTNTSPRNP